MKKIYFFALFLCASVVASAQVAVTFSVDLNNEAMPSADGVHIAGNFGDTNPAYPVWDPAGIEMMDMDMDGVYEVTLDLLPGTYEYKFINGNDWPMNENVPAPCQVGGGNYVKVLKLLPKSAVYYFCQPNNSRALPVEQIYDYSKKIKLKGNSFSSVKSAYKASLNDSNQNDFIYVGGSNFVVADLLK